MFEKVQPFTLFLVGCKLSEEFDSLKETLSSFSSLSIFTFISTSGQKVGEVLVTASSSYEFLENLLTLLTGFISRDKVGNSLLRKYNCQSLAHTTFQHY